MHLAAKIDHATRQGAKPLRSAVAVCLRNHPDHGALEVLLTKRAASLRYLPGLVTFPGGKADEADASIEATARRELREEVGLKPKALVQTLTPVVNLGFRYIITPVVFRIDPRSQVNFEPGREVDSAQWVGVGQALGQDLNFPVRSTLVEAMAVLYPVKNLSPTPDAWFLSHNSLAFMRRQLGAAVKLARLYGSYLPFVKRSERPEVKALLEKLTASHLRQAAVIEEFLRANDPAFRPPAGHPLLYLNSLQARLAVNPAAIGHPEWWTPEGWGNIFYGLFAAYHRALERCIGLRRVLHCDIPFESTESFWPVQWIWSALMMDAYFNAAAIAAVFPELKVPMTQSLLFQAEAKVQVR